MTNCLFQQKKVKIGLVSNGSNSMLDASNRQLNDGDIEESALPNDYGEQNVNDYDHYEDVIDEFP